jgi:hypothetical protein
MKILGAIFNIVCMCSALTLLIGFISMIVRIISNHEELVYRWDELIHNISYWGVLITSIYLCINYWIIRKDPDLNFETTIENIGLQE